MKKLLVFLITMLVLYVGDLNSQLQPSDRLPMGKRESLDSLALKAAKADLLREIARSDSLLMRIDSLRLIWVSRNSGSQVTTGATVGFWIRPYLGHNQMHGGLDSVFITWGEVDSLLGMKLSKSDSLKVVQGPGMAITRSASSTYTFATTSAAYPDSFPFSYVIGRGTGGNENYSCTGDSTLILGLKAGFAALATTGGAIYIKGNNWVLTQTDTIPSMTGRVILRGERGRTKIWYSGSDYCFYDTLSGAGKFEIREGVEFIGTANSLGVVRTGTTHNTAADTSYFADFIIRDFVSANALLFTTDDSTFAWTVRNLQVYNCKTLNFNGAASEIYDNRLENMTGRGINCTPFRNVIRGNFIRLNGGTEGIRLVQSTQISQGAGSQIVGNFISAISYVLNSRGIWTDSVNSGNAVLDVFIANNKIGSDTDLQQYTDSTFTTGIFCSSYFGEIIGNLILQSTTGIQVKVATGVHVISNAIIGSGGQGLGISISGGQCSVFGNRMEYVNKGIWIVNGTRNGYSGNWYDLVNTNVDDDGTTTIVGTDYDLAP